MLGRIICAAVVLFVVPGCLAKKTDITDQTRELTVQHNEIRDLVNAQVAHALQGDLEAVRRAAEEDRAKARAAMKRADDAHALALAQEAAVKTLAGEALKMADLGTGGRVLPIIRSATNILSERVDRAYEDIQRARDETKGVKEEAAASLAAHRVVNDANWDEVKSEVNATRDSLATLQKETLVSLAAIPEKARADLMALRNDEAALREQLRAQLGDQVAQDLEGLGTQEILAILTAAAGAAGVGGALGKTGRSRSARDVEVLRERVARVEGSKGT